MADMQQIDVIIKKHKWGIPCEKMSLQWLAKVCNGILWMVLGEKRGDFVRMEKNLNKARPDLKQLAQSRVRCRVGVVDAPCPGRDQGN